MSRARFAISNTRGEGLSPARVPARQSGRGGASSPSVSVPAGRPFIASVSA